MKITDIFAIRDGLITLVFGVQFSMENGINYLLKMPLDEIMKAVLQEALKDLEITSEEESLLDGIRHELMIKAKNLTKFDPTSPLTKEQLQISLIEQRNALKEIVANTYTHACIDGRVSSDEMAIYRTLLRKVDEIIAKKITMFIDFDFTTKEPQLLTIHSKIGQTFSTLAATIILDIFSEEVQKQEVSAKREILLQDVIDGFSSEASNKEFIFRFTEVLKKLVSLPIDSPIDLIHKIDRILNDV